MAKKLTQEEFEQRIYGCVGDLYKVISQYNGKTNPVTFHCNKHNIDFQATAECFMRGPEKVRCSCPQCAEEKKTTRLAQSRTMVKCAYCGKEFYRANSKLDNSKSGLYFCCREHKDLAQKITFGLEEIWPSHYDEDSNAKSSYRKRALQNYPCKCAVCGWDEDVDILEVHHIDENREHNTLDNLIILCPICHRKLTSHKYKLINREQIVHC